MSADDALKTLKTMDPRRSTTEIVGEIVKEQRAKVISLLSEIRAANNGGPVYFDEIPVLTIMRALETSTLSEESISMVYSWLSSILMEYLADWRVANSES